MATSKKTAEGRVVRPFRNVLEDGKRYSVGDVFAGPAEQVSNLMKMGYVKAVIKAPAKAPEPPTEAALAPEPAKEQEVASAEPEEAAMDEGVGIEDIKPKRTATRRRSSAKKKTE